MGKKSANCRNFKNKSILLLLFFIFLFIECSCKHKKYTYSNYQKLKISDKTIKLHATVVNNFDIYFPSTSSIINNYFVLVDSKADKLIKIIDLKSNELLKSFGSRGQGPDEFIGAREIITDPNDKNFFWIYDISTRNLKYYNINNILNNNFYPEEIIRISTENSGVPAQLIICPDKTMLGVGLFLKGRISIYGTSGNFVRSIGKFPVILKNEEFAAQHSHGFSGNFAYKDISKEIYIATRLGTIVEKYSLDGKLISTFHGPDSFFSEYDIVPAGQYYTMTYNKNTRFGYLDICYNKKLDRLFLLYSGKYQFSKDNKKLGNFGNIVYVLDNKDAIVEQIELDKDIFQMTISDDGSTLFGLSEKEILKYEHTNKNDIGINYREKIH